jgi:hypothetical protein
MCEDHAASGSHVQASPIERPISRRSFGQVLGALAGGAALGRLWTPSRALAAPAPSIDGLLPLSMAMHQHASFSEQTGSMDGALDQATRTGVNVIWWTDHDHRMSGEDFRTVVHFSSLTNETGDGKPWTWSLQKSGPVARTSHGGIVQKPASPRDPVPAGSLSLACASTSSKTASWGYTADDLRGGRNFHGNLFGEQLSFEVLPTSVGPRGYLELLVSTSQHPASGGRPAGVYQLSYRFGGANSPGTRQSAGLLGIVTLPAVTGQWASVTVTPSEDIAALWPDLPAADFALTAITFRAVSTGTLTSGYVDYLRFARPYATGNLPLQLQQQLTAAYADRYPAVAQRQGLEVSKYLPHLNWFGGAVTLPDSSAQSSGNNTPAYEAWLADISTRVHAAGGLLSYNHPYGYGGGAVLPAATQDAQLGQLAGHLLGNDVLGCDILEVGYVARNGADLAHHVGLWDVLSRHARFLTGNGVTDDHFASNWLGIGNNWTTTAWAASPGETDLLGALAAGRVWTSSLSGFAGSLDLWADDVCPMGSATVSDLTTRRLTVNAAGLPVGASVEVVRGIVDYTGTTTTTAVVATIPDTDLSTGAAALDVDTGTSCFVRTQVRTATGRVVALSNPVWLLREQPPAPIPAARAA